jgi:HPt (histidine-containing phosphotransfer) domain-containing protein
MKTQKTILSLALIAGLSLSLIACGEKKQEDHTMGSEDHNMMSESMDNMDKGMDMSGPATKTDLIDEYLEIKTALGNNSKEDAAKAAAKLAKNAKTISFDQLTDEKKSEVSSILEVIQEHSEHIAKSEIDHQIEHFEAMGKDFTDLLAIVGSDRKLYQQYCPMYNKNEGGIWLSDSEEIKNPLFAGKMKTCGAVKQVIEIG